MSFHWDSEPWISLTFPAKSLQSCPTQCDPIDGSPPGSLVPGILKSRTRVGCHFPLRCMKVKSESEVAQSCLTLSDPMDCRPPGSSVHVIFPGKSTGVGCHCLLRNISYWFKILAFPALIGKYWIMTTFKITLFIWIFKFHVLLGWQSCLIE